MQGISFYILCHMQLMSLFGDCWGKKEIRTPFIQASRRINAFQLQSKRELMTIYSN